MKKITIIFLAAFLFNCSGSSDKDKENDLIQKMNDQTQAISISRSVLDELMQTLPSPIETANIIIKSKGVFKVEILIPTKNAVNFADKYSQALALGGYGVDLGYLNLNAKMLYALRYIESIRTVSKELNVEQFFDFETLNMLAKNRNNVDSLLHLSTVNFNNIDEHLRNQNRGDLSVLILVGAWVEGLYMFGDIAKNNPNDDIVKRIGEQKVIIDNLYAILSKLQNIAYYNELKSKLTPLKTVYDNVKISYVYHEPKMTEVNGELVVEDNTETIIEMSPAQIEIIIKEINVLRNNMFLN